MALPTSFKPKKKYNLQRFGKNFDGGYLVCKESVLNSDTLVSLGINDDWSFEKDFKNINSEAKIFCYDDKPLFRYLLKKLIINFIFSIYRFKLNSFFISAKKIIYFFRDKKKINFKQKKNILWGFKKNYWRC